MAIYIDDCMCVGIIKFASLNKLYPGGVAEFMKAVGGRSCTDGELVLIDSMSEMDIFYSFQELAGHGLVNRKDYGGLDETWISSSTKSFTRPNTSIPSSLRIISLAGSSQSIDMVYGCSGEIQVQ